MLSANFKPKRTAAASRGFLATARLPYLYNKRRYVCLFVCIYVPYGRIETKLDTRTHVHPGSVSVKVNIKVIHVCVREWQNYETPAKRHLANAAQTTSGGRGETTPGERLRNSVRTTGNNSSSNEARRRRRRAASAEGASRTPSGGRVITASILYSTK